MPLYGRHGTIRAHPGQRDALLAILLDASRNAHAMPGRRLYVVSTVADDADAVALTALC